MADGLSRAAASAVCAAVSTAGCSAPSAAYAAQEAGLGSCSALVRAMKATGASAPTLGRKLEMAESLAAADESSALFPKPRRFALEWLCSTLRGAKPRLEPRCWSLLANLVGIEDHAEHGVLLKLKPPAPEIAALLSQNTRLILQAASSALTAAAAGLSYVSAMDASQQAPTGAASDAAAPMDMKSAEALSEAVQRVMRRLLCDLPDAFSSCHGFFPEAEALAAYLESLAGSAASSAQSVADASLPTCGTGMDEPALLIVRARAACHLVRAKRDAVEALMDARGRLGGKKHLLLIANKALRPLLGFCSTAVKSESILCGFHLEAGAPMDKERSAELWLHLADGRKAHDRVLQCLSSELRTSVAAAARLIALGLFDESAIREYASALSARAAAAAAAAADVVVGTASAPYNGGTRRVENVGGAEQTTQRKKRSETPGRATSAAPSSVTAAELNYTGQALAAIEALIREDLQDAQRQEQQRSMDIESATQCHGADNGADGPSAESGRAATNAQGRLHVVDSGPSITWGGPLSTPWLPFFVSAFAVATARAEAKLEAERRAKDIARRGTAAAAAAAAAAGVHATHSEHAIPPTAGSNADRTCATGDAGAEHGGLASEADASFNALPPDFSFFTNLLAIVLQWGGTHLLSAEDALAPIGAYAQAAPSGRTAALSSAFLVARAARLVARLLAAAASAGVYRSRSDVGGDQRRALALPLALAVALAQRLSTAREAATGTGPPFPHGTPTISSAHLAGFVQARAEAAAADCELLAAVLSLESRLIRPELGVVIRLLCTSTMALPIGPETSSQGHGAHDLNRVERLGTPRLPFFVPDLRPYAPLVPEAISLACKLVETMHAERSLPTLLTMLASQAVACPPHSPHPEGQATAPVINGGNVRADLGGVGSLMACSTFSYTLARAVASSEPAQAVELLEALLPALESGFQGASRALDLGADSTAIKEGTPSVVKARREVASPRAATEVAERLRASSPKDIARTMRQFVDLCAMVSLVLDSLPVTLPSAPALCAACLQAENVGARALAAASAAQRLGHREPASPNSIHGAPIPLLRAGSLIVLRASIMLRIACNHVNPCGTGGDLLVPVAAMTAARSLLAEGESGVSANTSRGGLDVAGDSNAVECPLESGSREKKRRMDASKPSNESRVQGNAAEARLEGAAVAADLVLARHAALSLVALQLRLCSEARSLHVELKLRKRCTSRRVGTDVDHAVQRDNLAGQKKSALNMVRRKAVKKPLKLLLSWDPLLASKVAYASTASVTWNGTPHGLAAAAAAAAGDSPSRRFKDGLASEDSDTPQMPSAFNIAASSAAASVGFIGQWALVSEHLRLIDTFGSRRQIKEVVDFFWKSRCNNPPAAQMEPSEGGRSNFGGAGGVNITSISSSVSNSAAFYELPKIRAELLSSLWRLIQAELPPPSPDLPQPTRARLSFLMDVGHGKSAQGHSGDARAPIECQRMEMHDASPRFAAPADWAKVLLDPSDGAKPLALGASAQQRLAVALQLASGLPTPTISPVDLAWAMPAALVLWRAIMPLSRSNDPNARTRTAVASGRLAVYRTNEEDYARLLVATLGFVASLCESSPGLSSVLPTAAKLAIVEYCLALPRVFSSALQPQPRAYRRRSCAAPVWHEALGHATRIVFHMTAGDLSRPYRCVRGIGMREVLTDADHGEEDWVAPLQRALVGLPSFTATERELNADLGNPCVVKATRLDESGRGAFPGLEGASVVSLSSPLPPRHPVAYDDVESGWKATTTLSLLRSTLEAMLARLDSLLATIAGFRGGRRPGDGDVAMADTMPAGQPLAKAQMSDEPALRSEVLTTAHDMMTFLVQLDVCFGVSQARLDDSGVTDGERARDGHIDNVARMLKRKRGMASAGSQMSFAGGLHLLRRAAARVSPPRGGIGKAQEEGVNGHPARVEGLSEAECYALAASLDVTSLWLRCGTSIEKVARHSPYNQSTCLANLSTTCGALGSPTRRRVPAPPELGEFVQGVVALVQSRLRGATPLDAWPDSSHEAHVSAIGASCSSGKRAVATLDTSLLGVVDALCDIDGMAAAVITRSDRRKLAALLLLLIAPLAAGTSPKILSVAFAISSADDEATSKGLIPILGPSGRLLPSASDTPVGSLRRLVANADDEMFCFLLDGVMHELRRASISSHTSAQTALMLPLGTLRESYETSSAGLVQDTDTPPWRTPGPRASAAGRLPAALICAAIMSASSSPLHLARISAILPRLLRVLCEIAVSPIATQRVAPQPPQSNVRPAAMAGAAEADAIRRAALQTLTALVTNDQLRFELDDAAGLLRAAATPCDGISLHYAPLEWTRADAPLGVAGAGPELDSSSALPAQAAILLPSAPTFTAAYFLLLALLRQRGPLVHSAVPHFLAALRGMLFSLGWASATAVHGRTARAETLSSSNRTKEVPPSMDIAIAALHPSAVHPPDASAIGRTPPAALSLDLECVRHLRRLFEAAATHRRSLVRYGAYILSDVVALLRHRPLSPSAQAELLPGLYALVGMCTQVELQEVHAGLDQVGKRVLKELLDGYQATYRFRG